MLETDIARLASEQLNADKRAKEAGKKSADVRNAKADATWRKKVTETAKELREKNPSLTQSDLVEKIQRRLESEEQIPTYDSLVKCIRGLERSGELCRRKREYEGIPTRM